MLCKYNLTITNFEFYVVTYRTYAKNMILTLNSNV